MNLQPEITRFLNAHPAEAPGPSQPRRPAPVHATDRPDLPCFRTRGPDVHHSRPRAARPRWSHHLAGLPPRPGDGARPTSTCTGAAGVTVHDPYISDAICRQRCAEAHAVVVALEYRLAPEHKFPVALNDAYAALCWLAGNADELGVDPGNLSVGGSSAGANLAAALTQRVRDEGGPGLVFQLLEVPVLDLTVRTARAAVESPRQEAMLAGVLTGIEHYLDDDGQALDPLVSPLHATDLADLPPAVIFTAEFDPLHLEGERYAERLRAAGVKATAVRHAGAVHGSALLTRVWDPAADWQRQAAVALRDAHRPG